MPNTTGGFALPYPPATGVLPDVPYWNQQMAEAVEAGLLLAGRQDGGSTNVAVASLGPGAAVSVPLTFAAGRFTAAPRVQVTMSGGAAGTAMLSCRTSGVTANGFNVLVYNTGTVAIGSGVASQVVHWQARQS